MVSELVEWGGNGLFIFVSLTRYGVVCLAYCFLANLYYVDKITPVQRKSFIKCRYSYVDESCLCELL